MDVLECRMSVAYLIDWLNWLGEECTKGAGDVMAANQVCVTVAELAAVRSFHSIKLLVSFRARQQTKSGSSAKKKIDVTSPFGNEAVS
jgi:hypothetical protein